MCDPKELKFSRTSELVAMGFFELSWSVVPPDDSMKSLVFIAFFNCFFVHFVVSGGGVGARSEDTS